MKKILIVACGLSMVGMSHAKVDLSLDKLQALGVAVLEFPANLIKIQNLACCEQKCGQGTYQARGGACSTGSNFEDTFQSVQASLVTLGAYKKGATVKVGTKTVTLNNKNAAKLKLVALRDIIKSSSTFIDLTLQFIAIIRDKMVKPILDIIAEQKSLESLNNVYTSAEKYKTKLDDTAKQISDIVDLISLLSEPEAA